METRSGNPIRSPEGHALSWPRNPPSPRSRRWLSTLWPPILGVRRNEEGLCPSFRPDAYHWRNGACMRCPETARRQAATPHIFLRVCVTGFEEIQDTSWQGFGGVPQFRFPLPPRLGDQRGLKRRLRTWHKVPAVRSPGCHRVATRGAMKQDTLILSSQHYVNYSVVQRIPHVL